MAKRESEREIIVNSTKRRPYGAKLSLLLEKRTEFSIEGESVLLVSPEIVVRMAPQEADEEGKKQQQWNIFVEGFSTAGEAEQAGLKIALGFLWAAVRGRYSIRLIYHTPLPCTVYDRTQRRGLILTGHATLTVRKGIGGIVDPLNSVISSPRPIDQKLLLATELFVSASLETTERARFIGLVSSLEPLAEQQKYESKEIADLIKTFKDHLRNSQIDNGVRESLSGQIDQLKIESVSRAIKRLINETLPHNTAAVEVIEEAYSLRSKILHEGSTDADLELKSREVEDVVRQILEAKIKEYLQ